MKCPYCQEEIQDGAIKCKHCGEILRKEEYSHIANEKTKALSDYSSLPPYYQKVFTEIDQTNGKFLAKWNWAAFFFGCLWYFYKGMWFKGLLMLLIGCVFAGIPLPFFALYTGIGGNWDYYLLKVKGKQLW